MRGSVDLEQSLETQRVRLLRLLAGWIAMLGVLSFGPVALPLPQWIRAELATQFLVQAAALNKATSGLAVSVPLEAVRGRRVVEVPSARALLGRMEALRDVLENLPRYARRLLQVRNAAGEALDFSVPPCLGPALGQLATINPDWTPPRIERPPDKGGDRFGWLGANSPCFAGGRHRRLGNSFRLRLNVASTLRYQHSVLA